MVGDLMGYKPSMDSGYASNAGMHPAQSFSPAQQFTPKPADTAFQAGHDLATGLYLAHLFSGQNNENNATQQPYPVIGGTEPALAPAPYGSPPTPGLELVALVGALATALFIVRRKL